MFWLELIVVLGMLLVGARVGGIFLGMSSGVSLAVLIFGFGCTPGKPPIDVVMIIMAVVVTVSVLQASGGMDYLIQVAIRMLRSNPRSGSASTRRSSVGSLPSCAERAILPTGSCP